MPQRLRAAVPGRLTEWGDRDTGKRPLMGEAASSLSQVVVVTSDNPRSEDPNAIITMILSGVPADKKTDVHVEPDRRKAIDLAIAMARHGDVVLIAGKGHEDYQIVGKEKRHFDDAEEARISLTERARMQGWN